MHARFTVDRPNPRVVSATRGELLDELRRIATGGPSTLVVSPYPDGKTSLLQALAQRLEGATAPGSAATESDRVVVGHVSDLKLKDMMTPTEFWSSALAGEKFGDREIADACASAGQTASLSDLRRVFRLLQAKNRRLVLLVDDFHCVLDRPRLANNDFLGSIRGLFQEHDCPGTFIATTQEPPFVLYQRAKPFADASPFLNTLRKLVLPRLTEREIGNWLEDEGGKPAARVYAASAGQPYLAMVMGSILAQPAASREDPLVAALAQAGDVLSALWNERWDDSEVRVALLRGTATALGYPHWAAEDEIEGDGAVLRDVVSALAEHPVPVIHRMVSTVLNKSATPYLPAPGRGYAPTPTEIADCAVELLQRRNLIGDLLEQLAAYDTRATSSLRDRWNHRLPGNGMGKFHELVHHGWLERDTGKLLGHLPILWFADTFLRQLAEGRDQPRRWVARLRPDPVDKPALLALANGISTHPTPYRQMLAAALG